MVSIWLQCNGHLEADTTQLEALKEHGSGTRAMLTKTTHQAADKAWNAKRCER